MSSSDRLVTLAQARRPGRRFVLAATRRFGERGLVAERLGRVRAAKGVRLCPRERRLEEQPGGRLAQVGRTGCITIGVAQTGVRRYDCRTMLVFCAGSCWACLRMASIAKIAMLRPDVTGLSTEVHRPFRKLAVRRGLFVWAALPLVVAAVIGIAVERAVVSGSSSSRPDLQQILERLVSGRGRVSLGVNVPIYCWTVTDETGRGESCLER